MDRAGYAAHERLRETTWGIDLLYRGGDDDRFTTSAG
jgi:hypothetical protein